MCYYPSEISQMKTISSEAKKLKGIISEVKERQGDIVVLGGYPGKISLQSVLEKIDSIDSSIKSLESFCESRGLTSDEYLYSDDLDFEPNLQEANDVLKVAKEVYKVCQRKKLDMDLQNIIEELPKMLERFKKEQFSHEPGSKESSEAYGYQIEIYRIISELKKEKKNYREIYSTFNRCVKYRNMINGVLF